MKKDVVVVGGGLVGLATALSLLRDDPGRSVVVVEKEDRLAAHQSGHNSGVIHSGLYYRPGSLKARTCVEGRDALLRFCQEHDVAHRLCGKLVVAVSEDELPRLRELERRGIANGLVGLRRLAPEEIREIEPAIVGVAGLWVPQTGVVDFRSVAEAYATEIRRAGGAVLIQAAVGRVASRDSEIILETTQGEVRAGLLVNCAGLWSDRLARRCGIDPGVRIVPFRGEYLEVVGTSGSKVRGLVYPVPDPDLPFLGVHFTRGIDDRVEAGPNAVLAFRRNGYGWRQISPRDFSETLTYPGFWRFSRRFWRTGIEEVQRSLSRRAAARALQRLMPELDASDLRAAGSGVRAQALDPLGMPLDDFHIVRRPGMIHVLNAPSPGATASLAIGRQIAALARS